ncbi:MAG: hypothetical protein ABIH91_03975, partial [Candidatus Omnitrophota bacterium]
MYRKLLVVYLIIIVLAVSITPSLAASEGMEGRAEEKIFQSKIAPVYKRLTGKKRESLPFMDLGKENRPLYNLFNKIKNKKYRQDYQAGNISVSPGEISILSDGVSK